MIHRLWTKTQDYASQVLLGLILVAAIIYLSMVSEHFLTWFNIRNILDQSTLLVIMGVGMTFVICTAGIDLSAGTMPLKPMPSDSRLFFVPGRH